MYLSKLNLKQKRAFLEAAIRIAISDGSYAKQEADLIMNMCEEMNVKYKKDADMDFDAAIVELNAVSTKLQRKEIFFELVRVAYSDYVIKPREEQMLKFVMDCFKLPSSDYAKVVQLVKDLSKIYRSIDEYAKA